MPLIVMNKVYCLNEIGDSDSCKKLIQQAYYCCDLFFMFEDKEKIRTYAKENFSIHL